MPVTRDEFYTLICFHNRKTLSLYFHCVLRKDYCTENPKILSLNPYMSRLHVNFGKFWGVNNLVISWSRHQLSRKSNNR